MRRDTRISVLLIEPHRDNRDMYAEYLRLCGCDVVAPDECAGAAALADDADVVITDIRIPGMADGVDIVRQIRARARTTPVVVLTACTMPVYREAAHGAGCDLFLTKPCMPTTLVRELLRLLQTRGVTLPPLDMARASLDADADRDAGRRTVVRRRRNRS